MSEQTRPTPSFSLTNKEEIHELIAEFRSSSLPRERWTHRAHLIVGLWHVWHHGAEIALQELRASIPKLNEFHGVANSDNSGYHESITRWYVAIMKRYIAGFHNETDFETLINTFLKSPYGEHPYLLKYYSREVIGSTAARRGWVPPDLLSLEDG